MNTITGKKQTASEQIKNLSSVVSELKDTISEIKKSITPAVMGTGEERPTLSALTSAAHDVPVIMGSSSDLPLTLSAPQQLALEAMVQEREEQAYTKGLKAGAIIVGGLFVAAILRRVLM